MARNLTPEEIANGFRPASEVESLNPYRYDFIWTKDYAAFRATIRAWYDDASYVRFQGDANLPKWKDEEETVPSALSNSR